MTEYYKKVDSFKEIKKLEENKYKLILSSPPYNVGKEYETKVSIEKYLETPLSGIFNSAISLSAFASR